MQLRNLNIKLKIKTQRQYTIAKRFFAACYIIFHFMHAFHTASNAVVRIEQQNERSKVLAQSDKAFFGLWINQNI